MRLADFARSLPAAAAGAVLAGALLAATTAESPAASAAGPVAGVWIDHTGQGAVEIGPCDRLGDRPGRARGSARLCGRVVWLKNPDHRSVTGKRICGAQILGNLRRQSANAWEDGWIFNPEDEERFSAALELANADTLRVTGYLGFRFLGETFTWKRAATSLQRCDRDARRAQ